MPSDSELASWRNTEATPGPAVVSARPSVRQGTLVEFAVLHNDHEVFLRVFDERAGIA